MSIPELSFEESKRPPTEYGEGEVHVRQQYRGVMHRGVMHYAVFDGEEQVSDTGGPLNEEYIMSFREGYIEAKERYTKDESHPPINPGNH